MNDNQSQEPRQTKISWKAILLCASLILVLAVSAGATMAYLTRDAEATNTFEQVNAVGPAVTTSQQADGTVKISVNVSNTDYAVYLRARVSGSWKDAEGNVLAAPADNAFVFTNENGWVEGSDGFWYYHDPVGTATPADGSTAVPAEVPFGSYTVVPNAAPETGETGYSLSIDVLAQAVQAAPADAVTDAWGMQYDNSNREWSAVSAAGN